MRKEWTDEEIEILRNNPTDKLVSLLSYRSIASINYKRHKLGIEWTAAWKEWETQILLDSVPNETINEISKKLPHRTLSSIRGRLLKLGLFRSDEAKGKARSCGRTGLDEQFIANALKNQMFISIINGSLLGDGHISEDGSLEYKSSSKQHVQFIANNIHAALGIDLKIQNVNPRESTKTINGRIIKSGIAYAISFTNKHIFKSFRQKWYRDGIKIVPDIVLDKLTCLVWFVGDGFFRSSLDRRGGEMKLCTDGFMEAEVDKLGYFIERDTGVLSKRYSLKGELGLRKDGNRRSHVQFTLIEGTKFLEYIGPCPFDDYKHKWELDGLEVKNFNCPICGKPVEYATYHDKDRRTCGGECALIFQRTDPQAKKRKQKYNKQYSLANKNKLTEYRRNYEKNNKDKINERARINYHKRMQKKSSINS